MSNWLGSTIAHDDKAAARIIVALAHTHDQLPGLGDLRIHAVAHPGTFGRDVHEALAFTFRRVAAGLPSISIWHDTAIFLRNTHLTPISACIGTGAAFVRSVSVIPHACDDEEQRTHA